jgi:hypothetical protein
MLSVASASAAISSAGGPDEATSGDADGRRPPTRFRRDLEASAASFSAIADAGGTISAAASGSPASVEADFFRREGLAGFASSAPGMVEEASLEGAGSAAALGALGRRLREERRSVDEGSGASCDPGAGAGDSFSGALIGSAAACASVRRVLLGIMG